MLKRELSLQGIKRMEKGIPFGSVVCKHLSLKSILECSGIGRYLSPRSIMSFFKISVAVK
jgi:hypothetical protein